MKKENQSSVFRAISVYFRLAFLILLLTAVGAGLLLAENGTRLIDGNEPDTAVLSSGDRQIELLFPHAEASFQLRLPERSIFSEMLPPPIGNIIWFARAVVESING